MGALIDRATAASGRVPDLILSGHVHNYQRFTRKVGAGVPYIVSGGGGYHNLHAMASGIGPLPWDVPGSDVTLNAYDAHDWGWLALTIDKTSIGGSYIAVDKTGASRVADTFTIPLSGAPAPPSPSPAPTSAAGSRPSATNERATPRQRANRTEADERRLHPLGHEPASSRLPLGEGTRPARGTPKPPLRTSRADRSLAVREDVTRADHVVVTEPRQPSSSTSHPRVHVGGCPAEAGCWLSLHDVDDREARVAVEAGGGEERSADVAGEERVAAAAVRGRDPLRLGERVDGEAPGTFEPELVAGARECLEEREAVARAAVAEAVAFLVLWAPARQMSSAPASRRSSSR